MRLFLFGALLALGFAQAAKAADEWQVPEALADKAAVLDEAQLTFLQSGKALGMLPERQLLHEMATRDAEGLQRFVSELMAVAAGMQYDPIRDMGAAPLNLTTSEFNPPQPTPEALRKGKRTSGPFSVSRYLYPKSGVPTFGGAPVAVWPEDLVAGEVDVAIVGVPSNSSSGRRDAIWAPFKMRGLTFSTSVIGAVDAQSLLKPMDVLSVVDYGNFDVDIMGLELTVEPLIKRVAEVASSGAIPMLVGGDTSIVYPAVAGVARVSSDANLGLLHLSAHADIDALHDHTIADRRVMYRLLDEAVVQGDNTLMVGLRGSDIDVAALTWLREQNVRYHTMAALKQRGFAKSFKRLQRELSRQKGPLFVSVDVSVLSSSDMIAAGRLTPGGLSLAEVTTVVRHACAARPVSGFAITDLAPMLDVSQQSLVHAATVLNACLQGVAVNRAGLAPDYIHPLALSHGR